MTKQEIQDVLAAVGNGNLRFGTKRIEKRVMYINKNVTALAGKIRLIDETTDKVVGVTNFPKGNQLPSNMEMLVLGFKAECDTTTATPSAAVFRNVPLAPLLNSELILSQDGTLSNQPMSVLFNEGTPTKAEDDFFMIDPKYVTSSKPFELELEITSGSAVGVTTCLGLKVLCILLING